MDFQALATEAEVSYRLQHLWGIHAPQFLGFGATCAGSVWFLATRYHDATSLAYCAMTPKRKKSTIAALQAVHEAGILHGDIRLENFIVQRRTALWISSVHSKFCKI